MVTQSNVSTMSNKAKAAEKSPPKPDTKAGTTPLAGALSSRRQMKEERGADKAVILSGIKQTLAEAYDAFKAGSDRQEEATAIADKAGTALYQGMVSGWSAEEVTAIIGDAFGFQRKGEAQTRVKAGDPNASKTPFGKGNSLRQRVFRMVQAVEHLNGTAGGQFFATFPKAADPEIEAIVEAVNDGKSALYSAYDKFTALKSKYRETTAIAFDVKKLAAINEKLASGGAVAVIAESEALQDEYAEMLEHLVGLDSAIAAYHAAKAGEGE